MAVKFSNNFATTLAGSITSTATTLPLTTVSGLPTLGVGDYTYLTLETGGLAPTIEIVKVTAINSGANEVTVVRAQDGTTASSFSSGDKVELRVSAILLNDLSDEASVTDWGDILNKPSLLLTNGDGSDLTDVRAETVEVTVKNVSGGSLAKGTPVHQTGTSGAATFEVVAADASNASVMPAHFVLLETLADQAEGRGLLMGRISGVDTSAFSEGDTIYVAVGGGYTNSAPTGEGNLIQNLGTVTRVDATNGGGEVMGAGRSNATPNLNNGNIFLGNASNQAATASLSTSVQNLSHYNSANWDTAYGWGDHATAGYQAASTALTTSTTFGGDVSGTYNAIVIADDSHNHVISNVDGLQTALDGKINDTGDVITGALEQSYSGTVWSHSEGTVRPVSRLTYSEAGSIGTTGATITDVYGEADLSAIDDDATFTYAAAWDAVESHGGRLPTLAEVMDGVGQGSGQGYDNQYIWTCTPAGPHHVWVVKGAYTGTSDRQIVDITNASNVYRCRAFFDVSRDGKPVFYEHDGKVRIEGNNRAFHDGYHPNADKWTTARTLTLDGDVSGSVSWDGSANATLTTTVANDSHAHSNYVLKAGDTMTGTLTVPEIKGGGGEVAFSRSAITTTTSTGETRLFSWSGDEGFVEFTLTNAGFYWHITANATDGILTVDSNYDGSSLQFDAVAVKYVSSEDRTYVVIVVYENTTWNYVIHSRTSKNVGSSLTNYTSTGSVGGVYISYSTAYIPSGTVYAHRTNESARFETLSVGSISGGSILKSGDNISVANITATGYLRGPATFTIDPSAHGNNTGTVVIAGNLQVDGTTTTINSATLQVDDKNIVLNYGAGDTSASANGAGITIQDAVNASTDATILWDGTNDEFDFSHPVQINRTTAGGELLHLRSSYDGGYRHDLLIENTNDRDVGITFKTAGGQYEMWLDSNGDDSLIFSPGDMTSNIALELYQNKDADFGGSVSVAGALSSGAITSSGTVTADAVTISPSSGNATLTLISNGTQSWEIYSPDSNNDLRFKSDSTDYLTIDTSGNILSGAITATGNIVAEDAEVHVGDVSGDNWTRIKHAQADGYGFDWQHDNATVIVNEQGTTNEALVLGDVDAGNYSGLFGIAHSSNGGSSWTKKLDLRGTGELYIGASGTSRVFHDGYHPNADKWTTARTLTLSGDVSGSVSWDGSANATLTATVANDSHTHAFNNLTGKTGGTGDYKTTGRFRSSDNIVSGEGSGGVALTVNDSKGNANVTFNHADGVPEQNGNAARIEVNTDSSTGAAMYFELKSGVTGGTSVDLTNIFHIDENGLDMDSGMGIKINGTEVISSSRDLTPANITATGSISGGGKIKTQHDRSDSYSDTPSWTEQDWDSLVLHNGNSTTSADQMASIFMRAEGGGTASSRIVLRNDNSGNGRLYFMMRSGSHTSTQQPKMLITDDGYVTISDNATTYNERLFVDGTLRAENGIKIGATQIIDSNRDFTNVNSLRVTGVNGLAIGKAPTSFGAGVSTLTLAGTSSTNGRAGAIWFKEYDGTDTGAIYSTDGADGYGTVMVAYQGDLKLATGTLSGYALIAKANKDVDIVSGGLQMGGTEVISSGRAVTATGATIGGNQTGTTLTIEASDTAGAPATTTQIQMIGYEGRGIGTFYEDVSYSGKEWFSGMQYGGNFSAFVIGYSASGGQAEYSSNAIARFTSDGDFQIGTTTVIDSSRNLTNIGDIALSGTIEGGSGTGGHLILTDAYANQNHLANIGWLRSSGGTYIGYGVKQSGSATWQSTFANFSGKRNYVAFDEDSVTMVYAAAQQTAIGSAVTGLTEKFKFDLANGSFAVGGTTIITASRNLTPAGITTTESVQIPQGYNVQWGGPYSSGNPSMSAGSNFIAFYPTGNVDGEVIRFDADGIDLNGHNLTEVNIANITQARLSSYRLSDRYAAITLGTPYFTNGVSNQAVDITLGNDYLNAEIQIEVTGGFSNQNVTGVIRRKWQLGFNPNGSIWQSPTIIDETIEGPIASVLYVSDPFWDSGASTYKIRIYKANSYGNSFDVRLTNFSADAADNFLDNVSMGSLLTNTTTSSSHTVGYNSRSGYRVGGTTVIDSSRNITNIVEGTFDRIGIGTAPSTFVNWALLDMDAPNGSIIALAANGTAQLAISTVNLNNPKIDSMASNPLLFQMGGTEKLRVDTDGIEVSGTISSGVITAEGASGGQNLSYASNFAAASASIQLTLERTTDSVGWGAIGADSTYCFAAWTSTPARRFSVTHGGVADATAGYQVNGTDVINSARTLTVNGGNHNISGGTTTFNVGRGDVYFENNSNSNASGAGITLRTGTNPSGDGSIFDVRSSGQAIRLFVGQDLTSSGYNPFYVGLNSSTSGQGTASNYAIELAANGNIIAEGNVTAYGSASDIRLKENIEPITDALGKVKRLDGVTFNYKKDGSRSTGVIAQQVQEVLPEVIYESAEVGKSEDGEKFLAVRYGQMMGLVIEAIKELSAEVDSLKAKLKELEDGNH